MNITALKPLEFNTTNLANDTTPLWNNEAGYSNSTIRRYGNKLYSPYNDIHPLCQYVYNDTDPINPAHTYTALDGTTQTNTAVICELNVTVVYVVGNLAGENTYYIFDKSVGTIDLGGGFYEVDFTGQVLASPANFTALVQSVNPYRHEVFKPDITPLIWEDLGFTNKYKCIDSSLNSITEHNGDMTMSFIVNKVDKIYLFNLFASSVNITVTDTTTSSEIFNEDFSTRSKNGGTWFNYFFNDFTNTTKLDVNIPIGFTTRIDITLTGIGGISKVGLIAIGKSELLGGLLYGAGVGIIDFSEKSVNSLGETYLKQGNFKETNNLTIDVPAGLTDRVNELLTFYRATPVVFEGSSKYKSTIVFGIYNKFSTLISTPTISKLTLNLESLT